MIESSAPLSSTYVQLAKHSGGALTAYQYDGSAKDNALNNRRLLAALKSLNYAIVSIKGHFVMNQERKHQKAVKGEVFIAINAKIDGDDDGFLQKSLIQLGNLFHQKVILSVPFGNPATLINTNKPAKAFPTSAVISPLTFPLKKQIDIKVFDDLFRDFGGPNRHFEPVSMGPPEMPNTIMGLLAMRCVGNALLALLKN